MEKATLTKEQRIKQRAEQLWKKDEYEMKQLEFKHGECPEINKGLDWRCILHKGCAA